MGETLKLTAKRVAMTIPIGTACWCGFKSPKSICAPHKNMASMIETALHARDERAAKIAETLEVTPNGMSLRDCIALAIRDTAQQIEE